MMTTDPRGSADPPHDDVPAGRTPAPLIPGTAGAVAAEVLLALDLARPDPPPPPRSGALRRMKPGDRLVGLLERGTRADAARDNRTARLHAAARDGALRLRHLTGDTGPVPDPPADLAAAEAAWRDVRERAERAAAGGCPPAEPAASADPVPGPAPVPRPDGCRYLTRAGSAGEASRRAVELAAADKSFAKPPNLTVRKWAAAIGCGRTLVNEMEFFAQCKARAGQPIGLGRPRSVKREAEPLTAATTPTTGGRDGVLDELAAAEEAEAGRKRELARLMADSERDNAADPSPLDGSPRRTVQPKRV